MAQPAQGTGPKKSKFNWVSLIIWILVIAAIVIFIVYLSGYFNTDHSRDVDALINEIKGGNVKKLSYDVDNHRVWVDVNTGKDFYVSLSARAVSELSLISAGFTPQPAPSAGSLADILLANPAIAFSDSGAPKGTPFWQSLLSSLLPLFVIMLIFIWIFRRQSSGGGTDFMNPGKNQAQRIISNKKFTDVAGQEEAKEEVSEVVDFLKHPGKYKAAGARIPKGIMLGGPPGTGKTLLAKAVAGEANVPFYFISASNFVEMFAGVGAKRVREMFKEARKNAPSILFIDELDAVGRKRGSSLSGNDEREQTLNQILVEMDGMEETSGLLIIAATNRPDVLDPALLRPGRFDRTITVNLPDVKEREEILRLHAKGKRISNDVDFSNIARRTPRYSGAQLENVINEATLLSVRENTGIITLEQVDEAIDRVTAGPAKKHRVITEEENYRIAVHEAGHAVIGLKVEDADIVQKITIIPRGDAGGYTLMTPKKELYNYSRSQLLAMVMGLLGGRSAEQVISGEGEVSTGASNDIERATAIARAMVTQYGMSSLGPIAYERDLGSQYLGSTERSKEYSDALAEKIDEAIRDIILDAERKALKIIKDNRKLLDLIVEELIEKETIVFEEIDYINKNLKRPPKRLKPVVSESPKSLDEIIDEVKAEKEAKKGKKDLPPKADESEENTALDNKDDE